MDASQNDDLPEPEPPPTSPIPEVSAPAYRPGKQPLSRGRKILRFLLGFLIVFSLGALLAIQLLYVPLRERASRDESEYQALQAQATRLVSEANEMASSQGSSDQQIANLQAELDRANLHNALLKARLDVTRAQLALELENPANARAALSSTGKTMEAISVLVEPAGQEILQAQQDRLELILNEIDQDVFAARSDLDVLTNNLLEIENEYFANPVEDLNGVTPTPTP